MKIIQNWAKDSIWSSTWEFKNRWSWTLIWRQPSKVLLKIGKLTLKENLSTSRTIQVFLNQRSKRIQPLKILNRKMTKMCKPQFRSNSRILKRPKTKSRNSRSHLLRFKEKKKILYLKFQGLSSSSMRDFLNSSLIYAFLGASILISRLTSSSWMVYFWM